MSEESQIFLKELHFLISDTVRVAENMLTSHEITPNDFLGGTLSKSDVLVLRTILDIITI